MAGLTGKVVLITGASSGIGAYAAVEFARHGCRLALGGRNSERLEQVGLKCKGVAQSESEVLTVVGDVTKDADRKSLVERTVDKFGQIDVLINNAGRAVGTQSELFSEIEADTIDNSFDINVKAHVLLTKLVIPHLIKTKGNVINNSSVWSTIPVRGAAIYCMMKAATDMFTKALAIEMAPHGVRVNSINPGTVPTNITRERFQREPANPFGDTVDKNFVESSSAKHPLGRIATTNDTSQALLFLASDNSSFITGQHLYVDGGRCLRGEYLK